MCQRLLSLDTRSLKPLCINLVLAIFNDSEYTAIVADNTTWLGMATRFVRTVVFASLYNVTAVLVSALKCLLVTQPNRMDPSTLIRRWGTMNCHRSPNCGAYCFVFLFQVKYTMLECSVFWNPTPAALQPPSWTSGFAFWWYTRCVWFLRSIIGDICTGNNGSCFEKYCDHFRTLNDTWLSPSPAGLRCQWGTGIQALTCFPSLAVWACAMWLLVKSGAQLTGTTFFANRRQTITWRIGFA